MFDDLFCPTRTRMTLRNLQDINLTSLIDKCFQKNDIKSRLGHVRTRPIDRLQTLIKFDSMSDCLKIDLYFKRRTGLMAEDVDADALKKSLKRSKKVKSQDTMSIESWKSTSSRGIKCVTKIYDWSKIQRFESKKKSYSTFKEGKSRLSNKTRQFFKLFKCKLLLEIIRNKTEIQENINIPFCIHRSTSMD